MHFVIHAWLGLFVPGFVISQPWLLRLLLMGTFEHSFLLNSFGQFVLQWELNLTATNENVRELLRN